MRKQHNRLEDLLKSKKQGIEYLKIFDNACGTNSLNLAKDVPLVLTIYQEFVQDIIRPTETSKRVHNELVRVSDEFRNTLNREQIQLLEQMQDYMEEIHSDNERKAFVFGYLIMSHLKSESKYTKRRKGNER